MEMPRSTEGGRREVQGGPWGLGDRRTLDEFIEFTGVSIVFDFGWGVPFCFCFFRMVFRAASNLAFVSALQQHKDYAV